MKFFFICIFLIIIPFSLISQETDSSIVKYRKDALKVFLDCRFCDEDYIRREISFVNYVRDRKEAEVHIMVTSERTGSGGRIYTFHFLGQNGYSELSDTLLYIRKTDETHEETRSGQVKIMKLGLMPFVLKTSLAQFLDINYKPPVEEKIVEDKWNQWVFSIDIGGELDGEKLEKSHQLSSRFSVGKVTPEWKLDFDLEYEIEKDEFDTDDELIISTQESKSFDGLIVKSLNEHWSVGGRFEFGSSTYRNYKYRGMVGPGIEYDIFPYSESTRKQVRFLYSVGYCYNNYQDTTIYNKTEESLFGHTLEIAMEFTQKWGSIYSNIEYSNYFYDWSKNNLSSFISLNFRIAKGLELRFGGGGSLIHDQLALVKGGASMEEILLERQELETSYSYFTRFSISYTFGSIYNNVVNPRFGNGRRRY